ncbi:MAG: M43 family zinc metalloprotease [Gammaproteobacteria bacterium]
MVINTNVPWSFNPLPGQYDVQSVLTHEFGHMLGFQHQRYNLCTGLQGSGPCTQEPDKNTMVWNAVTGETCQRDLSFWDIANADQAYP